MGRIPNPKIQKRNKIIMELIDQGYTRREIANELGISIDIVRMTINKEKNQYISRAEERQANVPRRFRPHLETGQTATLYTIKKDQNGNVFVTGEKKYKVAGVYTWHVRFERPGSHGNIIVKDYIWADLRYRLKMKGERVAC